VSILLLTIACNNESPNTKQTIVEKNTKAQKSEVTDTKLLERLEQYIVDIENDFAQIPDERKMQLKKLRSYINTKNA